MPEAEVKKTTRRKKQTQGATTKAAPSASKAQTKTKETVSQHKVTKLENGLVIVSR